MKSVAILQSNYIPWKGYFDIIAAVDEFILYDEVQFTKNDWRNRNKIKTAHGTEWLSVPVGQNINRRIRDVVLPDSAWQEKHWRTLVTNYAKSRHFHEVAAMLEPIYLGMRHDHLSTLNLALINTICDYLGIRTRISDSMAYPVSSDFAVERGKTGRLVSICRQAQAQLYLSGPSARGYLDEIAFKSRGITVTWFDYSGYPEYPQRWGPFAHAVSILDLLFNCGPSAANYMLFRKSSLASSNP